MAEFGDAFPLHQAIAFDRPEFINEAIEAGTDVNAQADNGLTPLMVAAMRGNDHVLLQLLKLGAKVNAKQGMSRDTDGRNTALHLAIDSGHNETGLLLLKNRANPNLIGDGGETPLNLALRRKNHAIATVLLKYGAKIDGPANCQMTPLASAARENDLVMVTELLARGADPNQTGRYLESPLGLTSSPECARALLAKKADVNYQNPRGQTALMNHLIFGKPLVSIYVNAGVNVNLRDKNGFTALALLSGCPNVEIAKLLVEAGADVNAHIGSDLGRTVLDHILNDSSGRRPMQTDRKTLVTFLRKHNARTAKELFEVN